jgi:hypothetical protein
LTRLVAHLKEAARQTLVVMAGGRRCFCPSCGCGHNINYRQHNHCLPMHAFKLLWFSFGAFLMYGFAYFLGYRKQIGMGTTVVSIRSEFQLIELQQSARWGKSLVLNGEIQSCSADERVYHESLVHPAMLAVENPKRVRLFSSSVHLL